MSSAVSPRRKRWVAAVVLAAGCSSARLSDHSTGADRAILYQSQAPGGTEDLRTLDARTGESSLLLRADSQSSRGLAAWSPDSRQVAYVREYGTRDELYLLDAGTGAQRRIGDELPAAVMFPDWAPNGTWLALSAGDKADRVAVFFVDVATGGSRRMRADGASYRCPSWSPQSDRLVVAAYEHAHSALVVLDTNGALLDTLLQSDSTYLDCPQWSPRGDEILFTVFHGSGLSGWERPAFHSNLAILDLRTRVARPLTHDRGLTNYGRWSRDGHSVVFQSDRHAPPTVDAAHAPQMLQNLEIYVIQRDGARLRRLTNNAYFDAHPSW